MKSEYKFGMKRFATFAAYAINLFKKKVELKVKFLNLFDNAETGAWRVFNPLNLIF